MTEDSSVSINQESLKTRQELVTDAIRTAILHGKFRPGDKLDQQELADELKVSRSPVRDAMRTLAAEELITYYPHRGNVVTERSVAELEEILHIRKLLEGSAVNRAATHMTDVVLQRLKTMIDIAQASTDMNQVLQLNNSFHVTLYMSYEQPVLVDHIQKLRNKMASYNRIYLDVPDHKVSAWQEHHQIYEACVERDGERAAQETARHLESVLAKIISQLEPS